MSIKVQQTYFTVIQIVKFMHSDNQDNLERKRKWRDSPNSYQDLL